MKVISWNHVQTRHKISAFMISAGIFSYLCYDLLFLSQWAHMDNITTQYHGEFQKVKVIENFVLSHPDPKQYLMEVEKGMSEVDKVLPDNPEISSFLAEIEQSSQKCGVRLIYLKPGKIVNKEGYRQWEIEISIKGNFYQTMNFFKEMENGLRFLTISTIDMQISDDGLKSKISAKIYSYGVPVIQNINEKVTDHKKQL